MSIIYFRSACEELDAELIDNVTAEQVRNGLELDLCMVPGEYFPEEVLLIAAAKKQNIPTLHVMDGILEWRNTWEHPQLISPLLQPVLADKIACLGKSQARFLESWGNYGKCEVVGSPRHDYLLGHQRKRDAGNGYTLLVTSARNPYFDEEQKTKVIQGFIDLHEQTRRFGESTGKNIKILWRLSEALFGKLHFLKNEINHLDRDIVELIDQSDAMITTPSTLQLEGMLCGLPVALLDYTNSPQYVPAAWSITSMDHFPETLDQLLMPPQARLLLQDYYLHDALECRGSAKARLVCLIEKMLSITLDNRKAKSSIVFPDKLLEEPGGDGHLPEAKFDLAKLYPEHPVYSDYNKSALQSELLHSGKKIEYLMSQVSELTGLIEQMRLYGHGPLIPRLVYAFPSIRKMVKTYSLWKQDKLQRRTNENK